MTTLYVDTETFNEAPITVGTARYCETVETGDCWAMADSAGCMVVLKP